MTPPVVRTRRTVVLGSGTGVLPTVSISGPADRSARASAGRARRSSSEERLAATATCLLTLRERQALLEADSARERLIMLRMSLREEMRAMRAIPSLPATEVARTGWSPN